MIFFATLAVIWFLFYWIVGGIFFACLALLKLMRLRKARFSCLFSLTAALCAAGAAWISALWLERSAAGCFDGGGWWSGFQNTSDHMLFENISCGWFQLLCSVTVGFILLILIGFGLLKFSSWKDRSWLTTFAERLELGESDASDGV